MCRVYKGNKMLDFRVETFLTVCQCMNYTRASEELNITQPAVSQHIRYLEKYYHTKLFQYEGKKMKLTQSGELLKKTVLSMKQEMTQLQSRILCQENQMDRLRLGASAAVADTVMTDILEVYLENYPEIKVSMEVSDTPGLLEKINAGEIDLILTEGCFPKESYEHFLYSKERVLAVCSKIYIDNNLKDSPKSIEDLRKGRILLDETDSELRRNLDRYLYTLGLKMEDFSQIMEIGNRHTVIELAKAGHGITFLYEHTAGKLMESGELTELKIPGFHAEQVFTFLWRKGSIYTEMYHEMFRKLGILS